MIPYCCLGRKTRFETKKASFIITLPLLTERVIPTHSTCRLDGSFNQGAKIVLSSCYKVLANEAAYHVDFGLQYRLKFQTNSCTALMT
jgi:hypothetical protein